MLIGLGILLTVATVLSFMGAAMMTVAQLAEAADESPTDAWVESLYLATLCVAWWALVL